MPARLDQEERYKRSINHRIAKTCGTCKHYLVGTCRRLQNTFNTTHLHVCTYHEKKDTEKNKQS